MNSKPTSLKLSSRCWRVLLLASVVLTFLIGTGIFPRLNAQETAERKLVSRVPPKYPEYQRVHAIGGVVRLSIEVTPQGTVHKVTPVGGNPILIDAAIEAVKQWKYAPAEKTDTLEVKVDFVPKP